MLMAVSGRVQVREVYITEHWFALAIGRTWLFYQPCMGEMICPSFQEATDVVNTI